MSAPNTPAPSSMSRVVVAITAALAAATAVSAAAIPTMYPPIGPVNGTLDRRQLFGHIPSTVGRLEIHWNAVGDLKATSAFCTGSTVNTPTKNIVVTAAHCVHQPGYGLPDSVIFKPAYDNGHAPFGQWHNGMTTVLNQYLADKESDAVPRVISHDHAILEMKPRDGVNVVDVVGGNALSAGWGGNERVTAWGYPGIEPYNIERAVKCEDVTYTGMSGQIIPCEMNGGSSGGPWFSSFEGADVGWVVALTSQYFTDAAPDNLRIMATNLPQDFVDMVYSKGGL